MIPVCDRSLHVVRACGLLNGRGMSFRTFGWQAKVLVVPRTAGVGACCPQHGRDMRLWSSVWQKKQPEVLRMVEVCAYSPRYGRGRSL